MAIAHDSLFTDPGRCASCWKAFLFNNTVTDFDATEFSRTFLVSTELIGVFPKFVLDN